MYAVHHITRRYSDITYLAAERVAAHDARAAALVHSSTRRAQRARRNATADPSPSPNITLHYITLHYVTLHYIAPCLLATDDAIAESHTR